MSTRIEKIGRALAALLVACVLATAPLQAQRGGIGPGGRAGHGSVGAGRGAAAGRGFHGGHGGGGFHRGDHFRGRDHGGDVFVAPLWYDWGWDNWYNEPYAYEPPPEPPVQPIVLPPPPPEPARIPSNPKVVDIPAPAKAAPATKLPPAIFVLSNGERIESQHYLLSADRLQITAERRLRTIPLSQLDLQATLAANRERGLDLHIPSGGGEISLGF